MGCHGNRQQGGPCWQMVMEERCLLAAHRTGMGGKQRHHSLIPQEAEHDSSTSPPPIVRVRSIQHRVLPAGRWENLQTGSWHALTKRILKSFFPESIEPCALQKLTDSPPLAQMALFFSEASSEHSKQIRNHFYLLVSLLLLFGLE